MNIKYFTLTILILFTVFQSKAQHTDANVFGDVQSHGEHLPFVTIYIEGTQVGTTTDITGHYMLIDLPAGEHTLSAQAVGYKKQSKKIVLEAGKSLEVNFALEEEVISLDGVVITGTKTFKRQTESPVIVNVLEGKTIQMIQANTLSEGLSFQPGLRVETDCQTCNYSQLRMNGLGGAYSQILINNRPVFSPLTGLYGLEQIPANMIDRIEVVRGGGSALYGSSAIGGTVNVITRIPKENAYDFSVNHSLINGVAHDNHINGNVNVLSHKRNAGVSFFASRRERDTYDHNDDNFSELPALKNNSFGFTSFFKPRHNHKLEVNLSSMYEYRYGGEITDKAAHLAQQSEERTHNVLMGGADYQIDLGNDKTSLIAFVGGQNTKRKHYTGIMPSEADDPVGYLAHIINPPYGNSFNNTFQTGFQVNHRLNNFLGGINMLTVGTEYKYDEIVDEIEAYNYSLDQTTQNTGMFIQSDWEIFKGFTLLSGVRADKHSLLNKVILNPRFSVLYKHKQNTQIRASWSTGFRAPQAFDADMHIAFAGGGVSRIVLANDLNEEKSNSLSTSINYDKPSEKYVYGFTLEGFTTFLNNAFVLEEIAGDEFGQIFEKRNASSSTVQGITFEARINYNRKIQIEAGYTLQSSMYKDPVLYSDFLAPTRNYLRTPDNYGFYTLTYTPNNNFNASLSGVYTGSMQILHVGGAPELINDIYFETPSFFENNVKVSYTFNMPRVDSDLEIFGGVKNIINAYQDDFDSGPFRDSNYIYGPAIPRTFYLGVRVKAE